MKNLLLKYGILPTLINSSDMALFGAFVNQAKAGDTKDFSFFINSLEHRMSTAKTISENIKKQLLYAAESAVKLLEKNSISTNDTMLSAFLSNSTTDERKKLHTALIIELSKLCEDLSKSQNECSKLLNLIFTFPTMELKLRQIAVVEFIGGELGDKYTQATPPTQDKFYSEVQKSAERLEKSITALEAELLSICVNSDKALNETKDFSVYCKVIRNSMERLHSLILNIKEL